MTTTSPAPPTFAGGVHTLPIRVYYEDTDFSGVVYHASYLRFMERGRTELLRAQGADQSDLHQDGAGLAFVVRKMVIDWLKPARMDDIIDVVTTPREVRGASMTLHQAVRRCDDLLVEAHVTVACVRNGRAVRIPDGLRRLMAPQDTTGTE
ncbi:MAG: tol-pal system-associated acyl-CoA thioesterase [Rhizobiales bacterium 65-9]|nr:tol-pal system-associated acyl-CoA thioesterase [Hyphomicrobiales bacterium]OJY38637.1 MAG: tol-pal system-associated acyl-CoA thioesterase [Rhizobiales bacterium 65-9]